MAEGCNQNHSYIAPPFPSCSFAILRYDAMLKGKVATYPMAMNVSVNQGLLNKAAVDKAITTIRGNTSLWGMWTFFKV